MQPREGERQRMGFNYNLEFRPDENTEIYFFGLYNEFNDEYRQQEFITDREDGFERIILLASQSN